MAAPGTVFGRADAERLSSAIVADAAERDAREHAETPPRTIDAIEGRIRFYEARKAHRQDQIACRHWEVERAAALRLLSAAGLPVPDEVGIGHLTHALVRGHIEPIERNLARLRAKWP